ncbi:MAG: hypothetical protein HY903_20180 [Deltaproteobacteria bacterium]|nr:hypothetical protein [Deltaproteobacteria bacterium]
MKPVDGAGPVALCLVLCGCAAPRPAWLSDSARRERASAYDWFLVGSGDGKGDDRVSSCDAAALRAWQQIAALFINETETDSEVVAVTGGPSRVRAALESFMARVDTEALRTEERYDDGDRLCFVELRWRIPRHLGPAVARTLGLIPTEESVGEEIKLALSPGEVKAPVGHVEALAPTPEAALALPYRGWFFRLLSVPDCDSHRLAFVGAPGGFEARWLELKRSAAGWAVVDDHPVAADGWPSPPGIALCD